VHAKSRWESAAARRVLQMAEASSIEEAISKLTEPYLAGVTCPPTDLVEICNKLEVTLAESKKIIGAGALTNNKGKFTIHYAPDLPPPRRRFTIAHEIGHMIIRAAGFRGSQFGKELERLCDMFATEILIPRRIFLELASQEVNIKEIFRLAHSFGASLTTTAIRYAELLPVSVFEAAGEHVVWGKGIVRKGAIRRLDDSLCHIIEKAFNGLNGSDEIYLSTNGRIRRWVVQYHPYGKSGRALILMHHPHKPLGP